MALCRKADQAVCVSCRRPSLRSCCVVTRSQLGHAAGIQYRYLYLLMFACKRSDGKMRMHR